MTTGGRGISQQGSFLESGTGASLRTIESKLRDTVAVADFSGANAGAQIVAAIAALPATGGVVDCQMLTGAQTIVSSGGPAITISKPVTLILPPPGAATFTVTTDSINNTGILVSGTGINILGGKFTLSGSNASVVAFSTGASDVTISDMTITGSGVAADNQRGIWSLGVTLTDIRVLNNTISGVTLGISFDGNGTDNVRGLLIQGNTLTNIVGTTGGIGYAIKHASAAGTTNHVRIVDNYVDSCQRHSVYQGMGSGAVIANNTIRLHRTGVSDGSLKSAIVVSRSTEVTVQGNFLDQPSDGAIEVDPELSTGAGNIARNVLIIGNNIINAKTFAPINIGDGNPASNGTPELISLVANNIYHDVTTSGWNGNLIQIWNGKRINLIANELYYLNATTNSGGFMIRGAGETAGTATYSDDLRFKDNLVYGTNNTAAAGGFELASAAAASAISMEFSNNRVNVPTAAAAFLLDGTLTDPNISVFNTATGGFTPLSLLKALPGSTVFAQHANVRTTLTYGATVNTDASLGNAFVVTATNGTAFAVANPTNLIPGQRLLYTIRNTSGGALGATTWGATFKIAAPTALTIATGNSLSIEFIYDGTNLIEIFRTPVVVPN